MELQEIPGSKGLPAKCIYPRRRDYLLKSFIKDYLPSAFYHRKKGLPDKELQ